MSDTYLVIFFFFFIASVFQQAHDRNARLRQHQAAPAPAPISAPAPATVPGPAPPILSLKIGSLQSMCTTFQ